MKLSRVSYRRIAEFGDAALTHGWESDQGGAQSAYEAEKEYHRARRALEEHVGRLEMTVQESRTRKAAT